MKQNSKRPHNLGETGLRSLDILNYGGNILLESNETKKRDVENNSAYQNIIKILLGLCNAVDLSISENVRIICPKIHKQNVYEGAGKFP